MPPPAPQPQPRTYSITLRSLLALPFRICNPPPAVGKVRSCGVTPLIDVRLEDILDRQHLPPLGLKDFEEYLLFVEMSPENLYFILWLREYKQRYAQWQSQTAFHLRTQPPPSPSSPASASADDDPPPPSAHLAMFFARAKQTFFTPGSAYELNLASSLLAPLHRPNAPAHPHPSALRAVERDTYASLDASRARFVHAQLNNVGSRRVLCGILAGIAFCLIGCAAPLAALFARGGARWARLAALPGLWAGLTVLFASINGICMGVYIFGDLRQLRRFELARPRISRPRPLPPFAPIAHVADAAHSQTHTSDPANAHAHHVNAHAKTLRSPSAASLASCTTGTDGIHISPAYFDADAGADDASGALYAPRPESALDWDVEAPWGLGLVDFSALHAAEGDGASTHGSEHSGEESVQEEEENVNEIAAPPLAIPRVLPGTTRSVRSASSASGASEATVFTGTATFIHPFALASPEDDDAPHRTAGGLSGNADDDDQTDDDDAALARAIARPAKHQRIAPFDFDGLPVWGGVLPRTHAHSHPHSHNTNHHQHPNYHQNHFPNQHAAPAPAPLAPARLRGLRGALARMQERCGLERRRLQIGFLERSSGPSHPRSRSGGSREGGSGAGAGEMEPHWSSAYWRGEMGVGVGGLGVGGGGYGGLGEGGINGGRRSADSEKTHMGDGEVSYGGVEAWARDVEGKGVHGSGSGAHAPIAKGEKGNAKGSRRKGGKGFGRAHDWWRSVPAFAVPLARVLAPAVVRAHWEIVVRSAALAALVSFMVLVVVLAVPVP